MMSIRKWLYKPKRTDNQLLAQFYFNDEELNAVSQELDSFDGRQDPERCTILVHQLRACQDRVLAILEQVMQHAIPAQRANRDFRAKFPDDVLQDSLAGQLWFGAECLAAGSTIMNREIESAALRPLARGLTRSLDILRNVLREQCYKDLNQYSEKVKEGLRKFDEMFAEFELSYVSAMVPVKTAQEYNTQQDVIILVCETIGRALKKGYVTQDQVDDYDPALMFTIPRLAIVSGLHVFPDGPLNMDRDSRHISELFRPFQSLLLKIKELLETLHEEELQLLEKALCSTKDTWEDIERQLNEMSLTYENPRGRSRRTSRNPDSICLSPCDSMMTECSVISSVSFMSTPEGSDLMHRLSFSEEPVEEMVTSSSSQRRPSPIEVAQRGATPGGASPVSLLIVSNSTQGAHHLMDSAPEENGHDALPLLREHSAEDTQVESKDSIPHRNKAVCSDSEHLAPPGEEVVPRAVGPASEMEMTDLFIDVASMLPSSVELELNGDGGLVRVHPNNRPASSHPAKTNSYPMRIDSCSPRVSNGSGTSCQAAIVGNDFTSKFPGFGKGKPSTELSMVGPRTTHPLVLNNRRHHSGGDGPSSPSTNGSSSQDVGLPPDGENGSFFQGIRRGHGSWSTSSVSDLDNSSRASTPIRDLCTSAINRVEGSRGCLKGVPPPGDDDDGNDGSSSCSSSCCGGDDEEDDVCSYKWESDGSDSDSTSYLSENNDELEIAMAIEAAEIAARQEMRSHFRSSSDLVHRLFVCIAGVADQLQTNYASDLRNILKTVFIMCATEPFFPVEEPSRSADVDPQPPQPSGEGSSTTTTETSASTPTVATINGRVHFQGEASTNQTDPTNAEKSPRSSHAASSDIDSANVVNNHGHPVSKNGSFDGSDEAFEAAASSPRGPASNGTAEAPSTSASKERKRHRSSSRNRRSATNQDPPPWEPDVGATECTACKALFTMLRRKHHCRNCGKIFCGRCSANSVPLPRYGQLSPVRVCNRCYMFRVTPFQH